MRLLIVCRLSNGNNNESQNQLHECLRDQTVGQNPINLAVRFLLELLALAAMAYWGWTQHTGVLRPALAIGTPVVAAVLWGTFRVPGDPGKAPVAVPGWVRLLLELAFFGLAAWTLFAAGATTLGWIFGIVVLLHYAVSYDRIGWLLQQSN
jgi:hypothetical protein